MVLYTCAVRSYGAHTPVVQHPCGLAAEALSAAGYDYKIKVVGGFKKVPFSRRGKRREIQDLTGQEDVPVMVTDDGTVLTGYQAIVAWAAEQASASAGEHSSASTSP
jgi:glutathione S-transferase